MKKIKKLKIIDLFCGCGGFTSGIIASALKKHYTPEIVLASDIDSEVINVYKTNFKKQIRKILNTDISDLLPGNLNSPLDSNEKKLQNELINVDILVAGPPCQGHSDLNNKTRRKDPRNQLYLKVIRAIEIIQPKIAIIENVASIIHDSSQVTKKSITYLKKMKYTIEEIEINANEYGVAQKRKRHILIAYNIEIPNSIELLLLDKKTKPCVLKDVINDIVDEYQTKQGIFYTPSIMGKTNKERVDYLFKNDLFNLPNELRPNCHKNNKHSYVSMYGRLNWFEPAQTITSGFGSMGQGRNVHPLRKRVITPHEAARIQGFSDSFSFKNVNKRTNLHQMIANAVPPPIAAAISSIFLQYLK